MSESEQHRSLVRRVCEEYGETVRTHGFRAALRKEFGDMAGDFKEVKLRPDAFIVDGESALVIAFECEVGNRLSGYHLQCYANLWAILDCYGVDLWLMSINQHGSQGEVDLCGRWYSYLEKEAAESSQDAKLAAERFFEAMGG